MSDSHTLTTDMLREHARSLMEGILRMATVSDHVHAGGNYALKREHLLSILEEKLTFFIIDSVINARPVPVPN